MSSAKQQLEQITKEEFDEYFKQAIETTEDTLRLQAQAYIALLDFRSAYRQDYKTHRVNHYLSDKGVLTYRKTAKRQMGFGKNE